MCYNEAQYVVDMWKYVMKLYDMNFVISSKDGCYKQKYIPPLCWNTEVCLSNWKWITFHTIHYNDVIIGAIASQITSLTIAYSIVYSDADQRKHQSSTSLDFVRGIHRGPVNSPHKWPVTRKMFPFDDVIMNGLIWNWTPVAYLSDVGHVHYWFRSWYVVFCQCHASLAGCKDIWNSYRWKGQ